jgi:hypothetical protein
VLKSLSPYPFSYLIRVVGPRMDGISTTPEIVFRIDPYGLGRNPTGDRKCITTHHYLADAGHTLPDPDPWSLARYRMYEKRLQGPIDAATAWEAQREVAASGDCATVHTLIVYPERRRIDLALATWDGRIVPAPESKPTTIEFDDLFRQAKP